MPKLVSIRSSNQISKEHPQPFHILFPLHVALSSISVLQAATILVAMASGKNNWQYKRRHHLYFSFLLLSLRNSTWKRKLTEAKYSDENVLFGALDVRVLCHEVSSPFWRRVICHEVSSLHVFFLFLNQIFLWRTKTRLNQNLSNVYLSKNQFTIAF